MIMGNTFTATKAGKIKSILLNPGTMVMKNVLIVTLE